MEGNGATVFDWSSRDGQEAEHRRHVESELRRGAAEGQRLSRRALQLLESVVSQGSRAERTSVPWDRVLRHMPAARRLEMLIAKRLVVRSRGSLYPTIAGLGAVHRGYRRGGATDWVEQFEEPRRG